MYGDTSQEEAANLLQTNRPFQTPLVCSVKIKRQFEGWQEDPDCTSTHLKSGAIPMPAEDGVLGRTRVVDGRMKKSRVGKCGLAGGGSKTPKKTTLGKQPLEKGWQDWSCLAYSRLEEDKNSLQTPKSFCRH